MAPILDRPDVSAQLYGMMGKTLGSGISSLLQNKIDQMKQIKGLQSLGLNAQQAKGITYLPPEMRDVALKSIMSNQNNLGFANTLGLLGGGEEQPMGEAQGLGALTPQQAAKLNPNQQLQVAKMGQKEKISERDYALKVNADYIKRLEAGKSTLNEENMALDAIESAMDTGKLPDNIAMEVMRFAGIQNPAAVLKNTPGEAVLAAIKTYLRNVKSYFGSRPVQWEVEQLLNGLPTLYNSSEGRRMIMNSLRSINKLKETEISISDKIIEENNGYIPKNLSSETFKRLKPEFDKIRTDIKELNDINYILQNSPEIPVGKIITDKKTNKKYIKKVGGIVPYIGE